MCDMTTLGPRGVAHPGRIAGHAFIAAVVLVLVAATISEGAIALGVVGLDASTGGWDTRDLLILAAACVLFFGGPVLAAAAFTRLAEGLRLGLPAVGVATGAVVVARFPTTRTTRRTSGACQMRALSLVRGSSCSPGPPWPPPSSRGVICARAWS